VPQDSTELRTRYGQPDVERFAVRPEITVTVEYGSDGKACILVIEPRQALIHALFVSQPTISKDVAMDVLDEVAPPAARGKLLQGGATLRSGCTAFGADMYENMQIGLIQSACAEPRGVLRVNVRFKRSACGNDVK